MTNDETQRGLLGLHDWLRITKVPAGAPRELIGARLIDAGALPVAGAYECEFRCDGLSKLEARLIATYASGSSTTSGGSTFADRTTALTAWTGVGAMTSTVEQTLTIAALKGEKWAKVIITTVGVLVNFSKAEVFGPRV
jgi:hypothetical protein